MTMPAYRITLQTLTAFGTPLAGDTLFGQLCWTLGNLHGAAKLDALLAGYTDKRPRPCKNTLSPRKYYFIIFLSFL